MEEESSLVGKAKEVQRKKGEVGVTKAVFIKI